MAEDPKSEDEPKKDREMIIRATDSHGRPRPRVRESGKLLVPSFEKVRIYTPEDLTRLEHELQQCDGLEEVKQFYLDLGVDPDLIEFLSTRGEEQGPERQAAIGLRKLREALQEYIAFDLRYGTQTARFVSEHLLEYWAETESVHFADPGKAAFSVRHRPCTTKAATNGLQMACDILRGYGLDPAKATLIDLGCGASVKALAIAMSGTGDFILGGGNGGARKSFPFKAARGVELFAPFLPLAAANLQVPGLQIVDPTADKKFFPTDFAENPTPGEILEIPTKDGRTISLHFADAAAFDDYNSINVIFIYNPFGEETMKAVERMLRDYAGKCIIVYSKPKHKGVFPPEYWHTEHLEANVDDPDKQLAILSYGLRSPGPTPASEAEATPSATAA